MDKNSKIFTLVVFVIVDNISYSYWHTKFHKTKQSIYGKLCVDTMLLIYMFKMKA